MFRLLNSEELFMEKKNVKNIEKAAVVSAIVEKPVYQYLVSTKKAFLHEVDSRITDKGQFRIIKTTEDLFKEYGKPAIEQNELIMRGYREAKNNVTKARIEVLNKEKARIQAAFPVKLQKTADAEKNMQAAMEAALLRIMYPNGYFVNRPAIVIHKDASRMNFANKLFRSVHKHIEAELLKGQDNGRIFFSDIKAIMGLDKAPELETVKKACSDIHGANVDSLSKVPFRSGSCWLDLGFSSSLKKGLAIKWEVLNFE